MRNSTVVGRVAAVAAVLIVVIAVAVILFGGGSDYKVRAVFENASQIVSGDLSQTDQVIVGELSSGSSSTSATSPGFLRPGR